MKAISSVVPKVEVTVTTALHLSVQLRVGAVETATVVVVKAEAASPVGVEAVKVVSSDVLKVEVMAALHLSVQRWRWRRRRRQPRRRWRR